MLVMNALSYQFSSTGLAPSMKDILVFLTGCDSIPPLGFGDNSPKIIFTHAVLPTVSTCSLTLRLPLSLPKEFNQFKEKMDFAILGSQGFFGAL